MMGIKYVKSILWSIFKRECSSAVQCFNAIQAVNQLKMQLTANWVHQILTEVSVINQHQVRSELIRSCLVGVCTRGRTESPFFLQAAESLRGHSVLLPAETFSWLLLLFLHSKWFAVMNKCYGMAYDVFSRTCPCLIQEISQLNLVCSSTFLAVTLVSAELFTDALENDGRREKNSRIIHWPWRTFYEQTNKQTNKNIKRKAFAVNILKMMQNYYFNYHVINTGH